MPKKKSKTEKRFVLIENYVGTSKETWHKNITSIRERIHDSLAESFSVKVVIIKLIENEGEYAKKSEALYALQCFNEG